ncbi:MAG TPA: VCBS repeat-containing protein [Steroidobacteraceae bacterium]
MRRSRVPALISATALLLSACNGDCYYSCNDQFVSPPPTQAEYGLVAGDFRHMAGLNDVIASSTLFYGTPPETGSIDVYQENAGGNNGFAAPFSYTDGTDPLYLAMGDLNNDGFADVVSASFDDGAISVFLNNQTGGFNTPLVLQSPGASQVAVGDVNGDGLPDIVSADYIVSLFVQEQSPAGTFQAPIGLYAGGANWVAIGNLHSNVAGGPADVVVTDDVGVKVLFNTLAAGGTTFGTPQSVFTQTVNDFVIGANVVAIADVNGDGYADLIITDPGPTGGNAPTVSVLLQDSAHPGTFKPAVSYALPPMSLPESIAVTPLTADGLPDIVVGGTTSVSVLLNTVGQAGTFAPAVNYALTQPAFEIAVADVTGGALPDIVVTNGVTSPTVGGVVTTHPGVLQQVAGSPGTYKPLQDLP